MPAPEITYRETHRRSHRILGMFLALRAWHMGVDCVAVNRVSLLRFLELERMRDQRVDWIRDDIKDLFPHVWTTVSSGTNIYATAYFSRFPIPQDGRLGTMSDTKRCERLTELGLKTAHVTVPRENDLVRHIALASHGLISAADEVSAQQRSRRVR